MSSITGNKLKVSIFGQSHSRGLGVVIDGLPPGKKIDMERVNAFIDRRKGGKHSFETSRKESDEVTIISGLVDGITCGAPLCGIFYNENIRSKDYDNLKNIPRPSHGDFVADVKYKGFQDKRGGGHFSARLTLPLVFAGGICKEILEDMDIDIGGHVLSVGNIFDREYDAVNVKKDDFPKGFPVIDKVREKEIMALMENIKAQGDSIGGIVECAAVNVPIALGNPIFDNVESKLSSILFSIPALKGVEFGVGFSGISLRGSEYNDAFAIKNKKVVTKSNHCGGIQSGITNGMPIVIKAVFKPTPSISLEQDSVNLETMEEEKLTIKGRHDSCILPRAVPCVEAAMAIGILDLILE